MSEHVEIQIACADDGEAARIAHSLVERRLAACVQRLPIRSVYRWDGEVVEDAEVLLLVKTVGERLADVGRVVEELHSYDLPAVSAVEIVGGSDAYLRWVSAASTD